MDIVDLNDVLSKVFEPKINALITRLIDGHHLSDSEKTYLQGQIRGRKESYSELVDFARNLVNATDE